MDPCPCVRSGRDARSAIFARCPDGVDGEIVEYMASAVASVIEDAGDEPDLFALSDDIIGVISPLLEDVQCAPDAISTFCGYVIEAAFANAIPDNEVAPDASVAASMQGDRNTDAPSQLDAHGVGDVVVVHPTSVGSLITSQLEELNALESIYQSEGGDIFVRVIHLPSGDGRSVGEVDALVHVDQPEPVTLRTPDAFAPKILQSSADQPGNMSSAIEKAERILEQTLGPPLRSLRRTADGSIVPPLPIPVRSSSSCHRIGPSKFEALPPLRLNIQLPGEYPQTAPMFTLSASWLTVELLCSLSGKLDQLWRDRADNQIIFVWLEWLKVESWSYLDLGGEIILVARDCQGDCLDSRIMCQYSDPHAAFTSLLEWWQLRQQQLFKQCFEQHCRMCNSSKPGSAFTLFWRCQHAACTKCLSDLVSSKVRAEEVEDICCPHEDCRKELAAFVIEEALGADTELARRWRSLRVQRIVEQEFDDMVFCSRCQHNGVQTPVLPVGGRIDGGTVFSPFKCDVCEFVFCGICCCSYHAPQSCWADKTRVQEMQSRSPPLPIELRTRAVLESLSAVGVDEVHFWDLFRECLELNLHGEQRFKESLDTWARSQNLPPDWNVSEIVQMGGQSRSLFTKMSIGSEPDVLGAFQALFNLTYKRVITKDRRNGPVPQKLEVVNVEHVQNVQVWLDYQVKRDVVARAVAKYAKKHQSWPEKVRQPITSAWLEHAKEGPERDFVQKLSPLKRDVHEHYLFHGTSDMSADQIARRSFQLSCAGKNAGTLYGRGIYLAESVIKADEYTKQGEDGLRNILVCRALVGLPLYTADHFPDTSALESHCGYGTVQLGKFHSVIGDREKCRGTFREFIFFNSGLVYPEFLVSYRRLF